jgi:hypothetical protein
MPFFNVPCTDENIDDEVYSSTMQGFPESIGSIQVTIASEMNHYGRSERVEGEIVAG